MASSVSKINIVVGANTAQLQTGMNQAAATVNRGMGNIQNVAQQATYAVDDFFAAFSTGGVAGGLRGAGNNLTMLAASIGGIKTQLAVVAGLAVGQLLIKYFDGAKASAGDAAKAVNELTNATMRQLDLRRQLSDARAPGMGIPKPSTADDVKAAVARTEELRMNMKAAQADLIASGNAREKLLTNPGRVMDNRTEEDLAARDEQVKAIDARISRERDALAIAKTEFETQERITAAINKSARESKAANDARQLQLDQQKLDGSFISREMRAATATELFRVDEEIAQLRDSMKPSLSMADMFKMMPGANTMGSAGAISAINAATIGPQNAQSAGLAIQREHLRETKRIRELEEKKKGLVEIIGL